MLLTPGKKLGPYEVLGPLGAGGMGEVYRARDELLGRDVAIKILPSFVSSDPEKLRRFEQEARAAAALNHPNILAIFQMSTCEGVPYLVSELLQGETLRERLEAGALPVRKALDYGEQILRGLAAAHEHRIVHRDLKPENIFVTHDGRVKILDFGLAKLTRPTDVGLVETATLGTQTEPGVVMGTVGYMSPEQVKGLAADHRSDLFSFGAILYEMLTGRRAFQRATSAETMTAILKDDPPVLSEVTANISPGLERIVHRCLEKSPDQRFQSASDLAFAIGTVSSANSSSSISVKPLRHAWKPWLTGLAAVAAVLGIVVAIYFSRHTSENPPQQLQTAILPPPGEGFWGQRTKVGAVSPDGKFLAVIAMANGQSQLWLRRLDASEAQPIAGTEGATSPFWSPDSHYIGFFVPGKLKKVDISGGKVSDICRAGQFNMGGSWSSQGVIVFAPFADVLRRVSDRGGTPEPIPGLPLSSDSLGQYWPEFLPDGKHILYLDWRYPGQGRENSVWIGSVEGEKPRQLALSATNVQYSSGYLLFIRDGDLFAQKFDPSRFDLSGPTLPVARHIQFNFFFEYGSFSASTNGILVYAPAGTGVNSVLTWMDRNGNSLGVLGEPARFSQQVISPDGKRVAVGIDTNTRQKIFVYDVDRGTRILVDSSSLDLDGPHWSLDGKQLVYRFLEGKSSGMVLHASDGSGEERQLGGKFDGIVTVDDWSLDGHYLTFTLAKFAGLENWQNTLRVVRIGGDMKSELDIDSAGQGKFSPDGRWLAFRDDMSGQVYVVPVSGRGGRVAVSSSGGNHPRWRGDGQELFYVANDQTLISVQLHESPQEFHVLSTHSLFRLQLPDNIGHYDVSRDGKRFLVNVRTQKERDAPLMIVTNWAAQF